METDFYVYVLSLWASAGRLEAKQENDFTFTQTHTPDEQQQRAEHRMEVCFTAVNQ